MKEWAKPLSLPAGEFSPPVRGAIDYIGQRAGAIQSVTQVAEHLGVNYHTLRSRFRRETRLTLEQCLIMARVELARGLIVNTDKQIKEIAWDVGYPNENQLTRSMKKYLGLTPQVIRRQHRLSGAASRLLQHAKQIS